MLPTPESDAGQVLTLKSRAVIACNQEAEAAPMLDLAMPPISSPRESRGPSGDSNNSSCHVGENEVVSQPNSEVAVYTKRSHKSGRIWAKL
jgi:hypothetical protein